MTFQYSPYAIPLLLAAAMTTALSVYALRRQKQHLGARVFGWMTAALSWWSLFYALSILGGDLATKTLFNRYKYVGVMAVPPLWLLLAIQYMRRFPVLARRTIVLAFVPALLLLPVVLTDPLTHLWWPTEWLGEFAGRPVLEHTHGLLYYVHVGVSYLYVIGGLVIYIRLYLTSERFYRAQIGLMIVGAAVPLVASILTQIGLSPLPWGLDSFFFTVSSVLMAIAIFRYRFLDIMPVAGRLVIEQVAQGVIVIDAGWRILNANPAARRMLRLNDGPMVGRAPASLECPPALREALIQLTRGEARAVSQCEVDLEDESGAHSLWLSATPLQSDTGVPMGQVVLMQDVTHLKQLSRLKDEFVATVSHDLRTPLTAILGYAEIAQLEETSPETRQHVLKRIEVSVKRMHALVNGLLDLATLEADMPLKTLPVSLGNLAYEAIEDLEGAALAKGVALEYELGVQAEAEGDAQLLSQVWHNLIDNAIKYTDEGRVTVRVYTEQDRVVGQVIDTGVGIPPGDLPYIFDKFFRGRGPATEKEAGIGLGLSLVKSVVEKHQGQIWVESNAGEGSVFTFWLPQRSSG